MLWINWRNFFATFVDAALLNGGLNQMIFQDLFFGFSRWFLVYLKSTLNPFFFFFLNFKYTKNQWLKPKSRFWNTIWFNPPFNKAVSTNIVKIFLWLINRHFPKSHRLHKMFNRNTVKISYSCIQNMSKIYKGQNIKITSISCNQLTLCNCWVKGECPICVASEGNSRCIS